MLLNNAAKLLRVLLLLPAMLGGCLFAQAKPAQPLSDKDKITFLSQTTELIALDNQINAIAQEYQAKVSQLQQQAQAKRVEYEKLIADFRKKYGAQESQNLNIRAEWSAAPEAPKPVTPDKKQ